ncbi:hypothetical protein AAFF_G00432180 [Aldrovandia affinis]|uniref:DNA helicase n=1 Tax=Aldrovandia affinis TaxID=143900 RepID=A0AAD7R2Y4_9TELE|nr:hypothetical protein AAFF_G00432180 [Aldrovandia affinis]
MINLHMTRGRWRKMALLSGDAGCGKSYAIGMLCELFRGIGVSGAVSGMTNRAAATLADFTGDTPVTTFHRMMGYKATMLDDSLPVAQFVALYRHEHKAAVEDYEAFASAAMTQTEAHPRCNRRRAESCAVCSRLFDQHKQHYQAVYPPFVGVNIVIIDGYGLLRISAIERMLACMRLFYPTGCGPLIIFAGSVSQLRPVTPGVSVWQNSTFQSMLDSVTPLLVNRRQFLDPGYAEAVAYLQYNTITCEARAVFANCVTVTPEQVNDPTYEPDSLRIYHQDTQREAYAAAVVAHVADIRGASALANTYVIVSHT